MKISYMLKREDFYKVNEETLNTIYSDRTKETILYIYPELNAIVTKTPSEKVKKYLYVEYRINASLIKKILVFFYTRIVLNSRGIFSSNRCKVKTDFNDNCLIYPCNKKYRIFNFKNNTVTVISKSNFPTRDIQKEIEFRTKNTADFIPKIINYCENSYIEKIIDGYPLARAKNNFQSKKIEAINIWKKYIKNSIKEISVEEYLNILRSKYQNLLKEENIKKKKINLKEVYYLEETLFDEIIHYFQYEHIQIGMSHGDLQTGNIWIENSTNKIYLIDWESYAIRSLWYDECTIDEELRMQSGLEKIVKKRDLKYLIVLYEDLIFHIEELNNLPYDYNSKEFMKYIHNILKGRNNV